MSDSNRSIRIALIAFILASSPYGVHAAQSDTGDTSEALEEASNISTGEEVNTTPTPEPELEASASDQANYAGEDLKAQNTMAFWTRVMGVAAIIGVVLSGIGVALVYTTFKATLRAARYSGVAARQAGRSLTHIKETTAQQLRPYVGIVENDGQVPEKFNRESVLSFLVTNYGQTPARGVTLSRGFYVGNTVPKGFEVDLREVGVFSVLHPRDERKNSLRVGNLELEDFGKIFAKECKVVVRLRVEYEWFGGKDAHDITLILRDPTTNSWSLIRDEDYT